MTKIPRQTFLPLALTLMFLGLIVLLVKQPDPAQAAGYPPTPKNTSYKILEPIQTEGVTLYPIALLNAEQATTKQNFLTLDEGLKSGEVIVTETGKLTGLVRSRRTHASEAHVRHSNGPEVNTLVLVNNSKQPLLLLAGEIVTGGRQDRIIAKDRIVEPESEPLDLGVFCIEPHRWTETSAKFDAAGNNGAHSMMVEPSVRRNAMAKNDQQEVWNAVNRSVESANIATENAAPMHSVSATSSYAQTMASPEAEKRIENVAKPVLGYAGTMPETLRKEGAVGVVAAVHGHIIWADVFSSTDLLEKYWSKLVRSYVAESLNGSSTQGPVSSKEAALKFVDAHVQGSETSEGRTGVYRYFETRDKGESEFLLESLLAGSEAKIHRAKMVEEKDVAVLSNQMILGPGTWPNVEVDRPESKQLLEEKPLKVR